MTSIPTRAPPATRSSSSTPEQRTSPPATPSIAAISGSPAAAAELERLSAAISTVRSGEFEARLDHGGGNQSSAEVRFNTGEGQRPARFQITSTYAGASGVQTTERITVGDRSWQRERGGKWIERAAEEGIVDQLNVFLPHTDAVTDPQVVTESNTAVLNWYDASRDVDVILSVYRRTGVPLELREHTRSTGATLIVSYKGWNTAVDITPPK